MSESGPVDEDFVPARSPAVHTVEIDGEAVLLDQAAERLHHLNATAALVWACLDGRSTVGQIAADLGDELDVPVDTVLADTMVVMRRLRDEGLLRGWTGCGGSRPWLNAGVVAPPSSAPVTGRRPGLPPAVDDPLTLAGTGAGLWDLWRSRPPPTTSLKHSPPVTAWSQAPWRPTSCPSWPSSRRAGPSN